MTVYCVRGGTEVRGWGGVGIVGGVKGGIECCGMGREVLREG